MYNKRQFKKLSEKKILHKIDKHWVTVSVALLSLLGGGAVTAHVNTNADTVNNNQNQTNHQTNISQLQNDKYTLQTNNRSNHSSRYVPSNQNQIHKNDFFKQTTKLHNQIVYGADDSFGQLEDSVNSDRNNNSLTSNVNNKDIFSNSTNSILSKDNLSNANPSNYVTGYALNNVQAGSLSNYSLNFNDTFINSADNTLTSLVAQTYAVASRAISINASDSNVQMINSYAADNQSLSNLDGSMGQNYLNMINSYSSYSAGESFANSLSKSMGSKINSLDDQPRNKSVNQQIGFDRSIASNMETSATMDGYSANSEIALIDSLTKGIDQNITSASDNYQNADQLLSSVNNDTRIAKSDNLSQSTSLDSATIASDLNSLSNKIKAKYGSIASRMADNYINEMLSHHDDAVNADSYAMNSLTSLHPSNSYISSLDTHDISEVISNRNFINSKDSSMITGFKDMNAQRHAGIFNLGSAISSVGNDIATASLNAQSAESILDHDVNELVSMNNSASPENYSDTNASKSASVSNQSRSSNNYPISNNSNSFNNSSSNVVTSSARNTINMDQAYMNIYLDQIGHAVRNRDIQANVEASLQVSADNRIALSASQMVFNDQKNPNLVNNINNASEELSSAASADQNAQQVASSVMSLVASVSANHDYSNRNIASNNSNLNNSSNNVKPQPSNSYNDNGLNNRNSVSNDNHNIMSSSSNNIPQSTSSNAPSGDSSGFNDNNQISNRINANSGSVMNSTQKLTNENDSNRGNLPQTGESSRNKAIASVLLAMSASINTLNGLIDRKRRRD